MQRISSQVVADRRNMLELLRELKVGTLHRNDATAGSLVDRTMNIWQNMLIAGVRVCVCVCVCMRACTWLW